MTHIILLDGKLWMVKKGQSRLLILLTFLYFGIVKHQSMEAKIEEIWKPVLGHESYAVSNLGRIKSLHARSKQTILKPTIHFSKKRTYFRVSLWSYANYKYKIEFVHRLVLYAFKGPPPAPNMVADHINNIPTDNRPDNLQWVTQRLNRSKDSNKKGSKYTGVSPRKNAVKPSWCARITIDGKTKHLGYRSTEEEAHALYQNALNLLENG